MGLIFETLQYKRKIIQEKREKNKKSPAGQDFPL